MPDSWDDLAKKLLPHDWVTDREMRQRRIVVAAELRELGRQRDGEHEEANHYRDEAAGVYLRQEELEAELAAVRAELEAIGNILVLKLPSLKDLDAITPTDAREKRFCQVTFSAADVYALQRALAGPGKQ